MLLLLQEKQNMLLNSGLAAFLNGQKLACWDTEMASALIKQT